ncbi:hypothetical protein, partial [Halobacterium bonnevillei]
DAAVCALLLLWRLLLRCLLLLWRLLLRCLLLLWRLLWDLLLLWRLLWLADWVLLLARPLWLLGGEL